MAGGLSVEGTWPKKLHKRNLPVVNNHKKVVITKEFTGRNATTSNMLHTITN